MRIHVPGVTQSQRAEEPPPPALKVQVKKGQDEPTKSLLRRNVEAVMLSDQEKDHQT